MSESDLNAGLRALAGQAEFRFDDSGRLVPADHREAATAEGDDQPERHAEGSGDGGRGNEPGDRPAAERRASLTDLIRHAAGY